MSNSGYLPGILSGTRGAKALEECTMRKGLAGLCGLCMMGGLLAGTPLPRASARASVIDKELLGVRLLQSYKTVLQLTGADAHLSRRRGC